MIRNDDERLAELLRLLPPAPLGWTQAAQELPRVRRELDTLVARAEADERFRAELVADLERALAASGVEPRAGIVEELRKRLA
jgi:hypothetical protein